MTDNFSIPHPEFDPNEEPDAFTRKDLAAKRYASDTEDRKWLAEWTAIIVTGWLSAVVIILGRNNDHYFLSDSVLIALLGTTTLNVLGLSFIVLRGHFGDENKP